MTKVEGLRDYALLSLALATGRRASELAHLQWNDIRTSSAKMIISWQHCKGNKQIEDMLPEKTTTALYTYLQSVYCAQLDQIPNDAPLWVSLSKQNKGQAIGTRTISNICETYLGTTKVHATWHTWAVMMSKQGTTSLQVGRGLGHSHLKTTSDYMDKQLGYENPYVSKLEEVYGI